MTEQSRFSNHCAGVVYEPARDLHWTAEDVTPEPVTDEEAQAAIDKLNAEGFGGFNDWRIPEVEVLFPLADRTRHHPAIDTEFFPTCKSDWYLTATDDASEEKSEDTGHSDYAWVVYFGGGYSYINNRHLRFRVRAVRGPARQ